MKCAVDQDRDRVVLAFDSRGKDVGVTGEQAINLVAAIRQMADKCEAWVKAGGKRHVVTVDDLYRYVETRWADDKVWLSFPSGTTRESIPFEAARAICDDIDKTLQNECYRRAYRQSRKASDQ